MTAKSDVGSVLELLNGYRQTCLLVSGVQCGLFQRLAQRPATVAELAADLGLHQSSLGRYLKALETIGMVSGEQQVELTARGRVLGEERFGSGLRAWSQLVGGEYLSAWGTLSHTLRTGETAFSHKHGMTAWEHRQQNPELDSAFQAVTSTEQRRALTGLLRAYDFADFTSIADIGGGEGFLLQGVLEKADHARGLLFEQAHVVEDLELSDRIEVRTGSFLEAIPDGYDLYLMKHVLHNWDDSDCRTILGNCAQAMSSNSTLLVLENVLCDEGQNPPELTMLDLHMMVVLGGRERSAAQYRSLFESAGLQLQRQIATRAGAPDLLEVKLGE